MEEAKYEEVSGDCCVVGRGDVEARGERSIDERSID